jgi:hypothetical protein
MAEFTFDLNQLKSSAPSFVSGINTNLYSRTPDSDLTYTGDDYIVWDRVNGERLRRGLPSLTSLGYPRPPEDTSGTQAPAPSNLTQTNPQGTSSTFSLKGPPGLTREQAFAIFKKQADTGSLTGFKPGESLSAASQAADGLASAQAALQQAQGGIAGALGSVGSVAPLGSISASLGAAGGASGGSLAGIAAGLTAAVGPAVSAISGALSKIPGAAGAGNPLVSAAVIQGSTAVSSIQTINKTISGFPVTNPINTADFTKVASSITGESAVTGIGPMSVPEVNGVLAQAKNLVGQASNALSNDKGLGSFGFDLKQLETAGYVKPGVAALAAQGASLFATVAKSPGAWTGKDGIKSAGDLLGNAGKQSQIQQDLMTKGVAGLGAVGVPVQNLSSQGIAGMALNAAKSLPNAEAFAKGLPIPGDATGAIQAAFSSSVRDGAFAVNLVNTKIPTAFKQQDIPVPKIDTVNRATLDAASARVVGDDKIPVPSYTANANTGNGIDYVNKATVFINEYLNPSGRGFQAVIEKIAALQNQQTITQAQYDAINSERDAIRNTYNIKGVPKATELGQIYNSLSETEKRVLAGPYVFNNLVKQIQAAAALSQETGQQLKALSLKIEGRGEGE